LSFNLEFIHFEQILNKIIMSLFKFIEYKFDYNRLIIHMFVSYRPDADLDEF